MDIVLNTTFNNPALPAVPVYGFADDFNRADAGTLGSTSAEAKPWTIYGTGAAWSITANQAGLTALTGSSAVAYVDAQKTDGILRATLAAVGAGKATGLAFRGSDLTNQFYLSRESSTALKWSLFKRVAGTVTNLGNSGVLIAAGDQLAVTLAGSNISVSINGVQAIAATDAAHAANKLHGLFGSSAELAAKWDNISFT